MTRLMGRSQNALVPHRRVPLRKILVPLLALAAALVVPGGGTLRAQATAATTTSHAAIAAEEGTSGGLNLFKFGDATSTRGTGWRDGDYFLRNGWKGTVKDTWKGNSSLLRQEMGKGNPIFDSYVDGSGNLIPTGGFLNMERNVLINRGWTFDTSTGAWVP